ncbi:hypothetical protein DUNSADRAFT_6644 [Dunaliella salina]|uniref:Uncharacterized protein n=1 Tax=Dunaliella salina TaxID=3046 RepID=A0ABQ7GMU9_DUNSA|nr:hypothetical protein DUNSADRAFT_6644 [Dunaliella salina]|eukprot:KAF5835933.1 hypothetical protein DUNSADRAFT_6644 [Dunaliella salina]
MPASLSLFLHVKPGSGITKSPPAFITAGRLLAVRPAVGILQQQNMNCYVPEDAPFTPLATHFTELLLTKVHTLAVFASTRALLGTCECPFHPIGPTLHRTAAHQSAYACSIRCSVCVVTGGNAGIGLATAEALAKRGAHVVLACRSKARGMAAAQALEQRCVPLPGCGPPRVEFMEIDLASLTSVRSFCKAFNARKLPLHLLVANGGVVSPAARSQTKDGLEMQFQVNFLSHWLMVHLLLAEQRERRSRQWRKGPQRQQQQQQEQEQALVALAASVNSNSSSSSNGAKAPFTTYSSPAKHSSWSLSAAPLGANGWDSAAVAFSSAAAKAGRLHLVQ